MEGGAWNSMASLIVITYRSLLSFVDLHYVIEVRNMKRQHRAAKTRAAVVS